MTILLAWALATLAVLGMSYLGYRTVLSLPYTVEKFIIARERIKREKLITEKLKQEVLNEQLKDLDED